MDSVFSALGGTSYVRTKNVWWKAQGRLGTALLPQDQKIREKRQRTQKQLAELSGISESALRSYELGDRKPKKEVLEHIATALRVRLGYLSTPEFGPHLEFFTPFWRTTSCMDIPSPRLTVDPPSPVVSIPLA